MNVRHASSDKEVNDALLRAEQDRHGITQEFKQLRRVLIGDTDLSARFRGHSTPHLPRQRALQRQATTENPRLPQYRTSTASDYSARRDGGGICPSLPRP